MPRDIRNSWDEEDELQTATMPFPTVQEEQPDAPGGLDPREFGMNASELHDFPGQRPATPPNELQLVDSAKEAAKPMADLKRAQASDREAHARAGIQDAFYSAFSGTPLRQQSAGPSRTSELQQQKALQGDFDKKAAARNAELKAGEQRRMMEDPNSQISRDARAMIAGVPGVGQNFAAQMGSEWEEIPASQLPKDLVAKLLERQAGIKQENEVDLQYKLAQIQNLNTNMDEKKRKVGDARSRLNVLREQYPQLRSLLENVDGLSEDAMGKLADSIEKDIGFKRDMWKQHDAQSFTGGENEKNREAKIAEENREEGRKFQEREVPGYTQTGSVRATEPEVRAFRDAVAGGGALESAIGQLGAAIAKYPTREALASPQARADLQSLAVGLQLEAKGDAMYRLGVLAGPDMELLKAVTSDPTSIVAQLGGHAAMQQRLSNMLRSARTKLAEKAKVLGYSRSGAPAPNGVAADAVDRPVAPGKALVRNPKSRQLEEIDAAEWDANPGAEGYVLVKRGK